MMAPFMRVIFAIIAYICLCFIEVIVLAPSSACFSMGVEKGGQGPPWILKFLAQKVVFLLSSGKYEYPPLLTTPGKI